MAEQDESDSESQTFAARLRAARAWANISQKELAAELARRPKSAKLPTSLMSVKRAEAGGSAETTRSAMAEAIVDITGVPRWFMDYGWDVPVDLVDGGARLADDVAAHARRLKGVEGMLDQVVMNSNTRNIEIGQLEKRIAQTAQDSFSAADRLELAVSRLSRRVDALMPTSADATADSAEAQSQAPKLRSVRSGPKKNAPQK